MMFKMSSVRVFWFMVAFYGAFIDILIAPLNEARVAAKANEPRDIGTTKNMTTMPNTTMLPTTAPDTTFLPSSSSAMTYDQSQTYPPFKPSAAAPPPTNTTSPFLTIGESPITNLTTANSTITNPSGFNTPNVTGSFPASTTTTTTECPDIFAAAEPAYYNVPKSPNNTNSESVHQVPVDSQKVLVRQQSIMLSKLVPLPMQLNQQGAQVQPYAVVDQSPAYRMDYYYLAPIVGGYSSTDKQGSPSEVQQPYILVNEAQAYQQGPQFQEQYQPAQMYQQGPQSQNQTYMIVDQPPSYRVQPYVLIGQAPAYQQGAQLQALPYMMATQAPAYQQDAQPQALPYMIAGQVPTYQQGPQLQPYFPVDQGPANNMDYYDTGPWAGTYAGVETGYQPQSDGVIQQPYKDDVIMSIPPPWPYNNLTLSKPDAKIVKQDMGNNNIQPGL